MNIIDIKNTKCTYTKIARSGIRTRAHNVNKTNRSDYNAALTTTTTTVTPQGDSGETADSE